MHDLDARSLRSLLEALGAHLADEGVHVSVLVVGGAALALKGWVARATHDVDVLALVDESTGSAALGSTVVAFGLDWRDARPSSPSSCSPLRTETLRASTHRTSSHCARQMQNSKLLARGSSNRMRSTSSRRSSTR